MDVHFGPKTDVTKDRSGCRPSEIDKNSSDCSAVVYCTECRLPGTDHIATIAYVVDLCRRHLNWLESKSQNQAPCEFLSCSVYTSSVLNAPVACDIV